MIQRHLAIDCFSIRCQKMKRKHLMWLNNWGVLTDVCLTEFAGKQLCSDLVRSRACVWAPNSGWGGLIAGLSLGDLWDLFPSLWGLCSALYSISEHVGHGLVLCAGRAAKSFPIPVPTAFSPLWSACFRHFPFPGIFAFGFLAHGSVYLPYTSGSYYWFQWRLLM